MIVRPNFHLSCGLAGPARPIHNGPTPKWSLLVFYFREKPHITQPAELSFVAGSTLNKAGTE